MSLIRSELYAARKSPANGSGLFHFGLDSYGSDIYTEPYTMTGSPSPPRVGPNPTGVSSLYDLQVSSNLYQFMAHSQSQTQSPFMAADNNSSLLSLSSNISHQSSQSFSGGGDNRSPNFEMDFDEDEIRIKLQELEHALLDDTDTDLLDPYRDLGIEPGWEASIKDKLSPISPNQCSSESSVSCSGEARTPKQLLFDCAAAIADGNTYEAQTVINELRKFVSIQGDPPQRLAAYLVEGLAARIESSGKGIYRALKCKEPPSSYQLSAMQILFEVCPCFRFGFMAANYAIIEAAKGEDAVHIIDFDINQGTQYINLIQTLANLACGSKPRKLRITGVDDRESVQRQIGGLRIIGQRLEKLAEDYGINFEFNAVEDSVGEVRPEMLDCKIGEAVIVNFAFQLHHMPDETVSPVNYRDRLLRMVKSLGPKLVTVVEQDVNTNTAPFLPRFAAVYNYYSAIFDSLDATLPRESTDRMNVERQCLAREIVNILACEGTDRIERYEPAGKWRSRLEMAGFVSCPFSANVSTALKTLLKSSYCDRYRFEQDAGALHFGWENRILVVASAWR